MKKADSKTKNVYKEERTKRNKVRKIAKHLRKYPTDRTVHGTLPKFPAFIRKEGIKPTMMYDIDGYWNKKTKKVEVPHIMYAVVAKPHVLVEYTHLYSAAAEAFKDCKCTAWLYRITNNKEIVIMDSKRAKPLLSEKELMEMAYGKLKELTKK